MLVSLRKANMLQLVADLLTLGTAGIGTDPYSQGNKGGYGQDSNTGEQCAIRFRHVFEALTARPLLVLGQLPPAGMLLASNAPCQAKSLFYISASQLA